MTIIKTAPVIIKKYTETPAKILISAKNNNPFVNNSVFDYVHTNNLSAVFKTDEVVISTITPKQQSKLVGALKNLGVNFNVRKAQ